MEITLPIFNALAVACGRAGLLQRTFDAVDLMRAAGGHEPGRDDVERASLLVRAHGDAELAWETYKRSRKAGQPPNEVALNIIIGVTLLKIRELTDPENKGNAKRQRQSEANADANESRASRNATGDVEPEWKEWADRAIAVYHEATVAGVRPRLATFQRHAGVPSPPTLPALRAVDRDVARARTPTDWRAGRCLGRTTRTRTRASTTRSRALILYEEAQALGVVPKFYMERRLNVYDIRGFPPAAAEGGCADAPSRVSAVLGLARRGGEDGPPQRHAPRAERRRDGEMLSDGDRSNRRLARTGDRVVVLFRRLRFNYGGSLERGRIELSGNVIRRWLKAKPTRRRRRCPARNPACGWRAEDQTRSHSRARTRRRRRGVVDRARGFFGASPATTGRWSGLGRRRGWTFSAPTISGTARTARMRDSEFHAAQGEAELEPRNKGWVQDDADEDCMMSELTRITGASRDSYDGDGSSRDDAEAEGA